MCEYLLSLILNLSNLDEIHLDFGRENKVQDEFGKKFCESIEKTSVLHKLNINIYTYSLGKSKKTNN